MQLRGAVGVSRDCIWSWALRWLFPLSLGFLGGTWMLGVGSGDLRSRGSATLLLGGPWITSGRLAGLEGSVLLTAGVT